MSEATSGNAAAAIPGIASLTRATTSLLRASGVTAAHACSIVAIRFTLPVPRPACHPFIARHNQTEAGA